MIDFTTTLPKAVTVNGRDFLLKTDFRNWLKFDRILQKKGLKKLTYEDLLTVLDTEEMPYQDELPELLSGILDFYADKNPCPKDFGGNSGKVLDYTIDSDYLYSAFLAQYGVDLCEAEHLHWHKFLALLRGISDDSMLGKIMSYRGYKDNKKSYEKQMQELKAMWELPVEYTEEEQEQINSFNDYFG